MPSVVFILCVSHNNRASHEQADVPVDREDVRNNIANGQFKPGHVLLPERELMVQIPITGVTIRRVFKEWINEFWLENLHCWVRPDRWTFAHEIQR